MFNMVTLVREVASECRYVTWETRNVLPLLVGTQALPFALHIF